MLATHVLTGAIFRVYVCTSILHIESAIFSEDLDDFLQKVFADSEYLEERSGLKKMKEAVDLDDVMGFDSDDDF